MSLAILVKNKEDLCIADIVILKKYQKNLDLFIIENRHLLSENQKRKLWAESHEIIHFINHNK